MLQQLMLLVIVLIPVLAVLIWRLVVDARRQEIARLHEDVAVARRERDEARAEHAAKPRTRGLDDRGPSHRSLAPCGRDHRAVQRPKSARRRMIRVRRFHREVDHKSQNRYFP